MSANNSHSALADFRSVPTATIGDNLCRLAGPVGLKRFHARGVLCGRALTVKTRPGDNRALHEALRIIEPGEVLVVDGGGDTSRALVGEIMLEIGLIKGAAGFVIDGAIRDSDAFAANDFPCYARGVTHHGPFKDGPGEIGIAVSVGGQIVSPGDCVIGDMDGVITFPFAMAPDLLAACNAQIERELEIIKSIREGRYLDGYASSLISQSHRSAS
jgi:regulator of RNase E activity RraA